MLTEASNIFDEVPRSLKVERICGIWIPQASSDPTYAKLLVHRHSVRRYCSHNPSHEAIPRETDSTPPSAITDKAPYRTPSITKFRRNPTFFSAVYSSSVLYNL